MILYHVGAASTALAAQPSVSPNPPSPDEIKAEVKADVRVVKKLQGLEGFFSHTLVKVVRFLKLNCDLSEAQLFLDTFIGTEDFSSCDNFDKLIRLLQRDHIDIFNTSRLQEFVASFERVELTRFVDAYEEKKQSFLKNTTVLNFQRAVVSRVEPVLPKGRAVVTIKIPKEMASRRTLKDIEELAMKGFKECYKSLVRLHAEAGSIIISWIFPEALSGKLEKLANDNAAIFKANKVEEVTVGGRKVYPVIQQEVRTQIRCSMINLLYSILQDIPTHSQGIIHAGVV